jgi:hypothetical protein
MKAATQNWLDNPRLSHVQACAPRSRSGSTPHPDCRREIINEQVEARDEKHRCHRAPIDKAGAFARANQLDFTNGRLYYVARADWLRFGSLLQTGSSGGKPPL